MFIIIGGVLSCLRNFKVEMNFWEIRENCESNLLFRDVDKRIKIWMERLSLFLLL